MFVLLFFYNNKLNKMKFTKPIFFHTNFLGFLLLLIFTSGCSLKTNAPEYQPNNQLKKNFINQLDEGSTHLFSNYHTMVERTKKGEYVRKQFYPDTRQITHYYTYSDIELTDKTGYAKEWWDNGDMRFEGNFTNGKRTGEWKTYNNYTDETSVSTGQYDDGEK